MYRKPVQPLFVCAYALLIGAPTTTLWSQQPENRPVAAPLASTSIAPLQDKSASHVDELTIGSWYFLGPYVDEDGTQMKIGNTQIGGLDYDYPAAAGHPEAQLDIDALKALCKGGDGCTAYASGGPIINLLKQFPGRPHTVLYAAAILDSSTDGYVGLQYDISFGAKIWINGQPVDEYRATTRHPVSMYIHFAPLHLKKGANVLVIKTNQDNLGAVYEPWALAASIMPIEHMWNFVLSNQDGFLLANRLLKPGDPIHIPLLDSPMMLDRTEAITVSIMRQGESVSNTRIARDDSGVITLPQLDSGYYKVRLNVGGRFIDDTFYLGDPTAVHDALAAIQAKTSDQSDEFMQRDAIIKRYEILTLPQYQLPTEPNWQKKFMMVIEDAEASITDQSKPLWYLRPGPHLREYISAGDKSHQNYLLNIPETAKGNMGLVIVVPYAVPKHRPFLESTFISYSVVLEQIRQASDQTNLAVAIVGARDPLGGSPIDEADDLDVLKDIVSHYSIDPKRIYLYGVCEGGRNALLLAEHHPGIFAAVGAWGPTLAASQDPSEDPVLLAKEVANTPLVLFKGDLDNELPNSALLAFGRILKSLGNQNVTLQIVPNAMHDPIRMESVIFPLLAHYQNENRGKSIDDIAVKSVGDMSAQ